MQIGELATATATKVTTIRFYEGIGLLGRPARAVASSGTMAGMERQQRVVGLVALVVAALLAVVVVKLFTVELADHGSLYRIVSFIGVGILLLIVGYFAPVPAKEPAFTDDAPETSPKEQA